MIYEYPTMVLQGLEPSILFMTGVNGKETIELVTKVNIWDKERNFVISRELESEKERTQLSLLEREEYEHLFYVTNPELPSEYVVISYEKHRNAEIYIKEAKYNRAVGYLLLKPFWANEAVVQMMIFAYYLFLVFTFDSFHIPGY